LKGGKTNAEIANLRFNIQAWVLMDLEDKMQAHEHDLSTFQLPSPNHGDRAAVMELDEEMRRSAMSRTLREELCYDISKQRIAAEEHIQLLTTRQREVVDVVLSAVDEEHPLALFVHANAGCGKTFTLNTILQAVRGRDHVAMAVASSRIAATLMDGGRTAHPRFKFPIDADRNSTCMFSVKSETANLIRKARVIVWDEAPMAHRHLLECLDRCYK
jgi:ATP-dependent DNA helicase PIF1